MSNAIEYHLRELETARNPASNDHILPPVGKDCRTMLDIGCGVGQTLIALNLLSDQSGYGVDPDARAIEYGKGLVPGNVHLSVGSAEKLDFADNFFDLVFSRVAFPYMKVALALPEMHRVLKPGGELWLALHPVKFYSDRVRESLRHGRFKDVLICGFAVANGLLFTLTGKQIMLGSKTEFFQTAGGMRRALLRAGFEAVETEEQPFLVARAHKACT